MTFPDPDSVIRHLIDLLGGPDAAFERLDDEFNRTKAVWDQNSQFIGRILRAHLFVEHFLTEYLRTKSPQLGSLDKARLTFAQKISLLDSGEPNINDLLPGIRRLNQVRNRLAHSLHAGLSADDANVMLGCLPFRFLRIESAKTKLQTPSVEPIDVLEDFAFHAGMRLHTAVSETGAKWAEAIQLAVEEATVSKAD